MTPSPQTQTLTSREEFEAHCKECGYKLTRYQNGNYVYENTADAFRTWQAAVSAILARVEPMPEFLMQHAAQMSEAILYSGYSDEPYIDIGGADLWCNAEDFTRGSRWQIRFLVEAANYVRQLARRAAVSVSQVKPQPTGVGE